TETSIGRGTTSVSHSAVDMATDHLGTLAGRRVLVCGAGEMGKGIVVSLVGAGANDVTVTNRTESRARELADSVGGRVVPFAELPSALAAADVLLACTGSGGVLIDREMLAEARAGIDSPLLVVDIAVPRDVAADVVSLPGVTLLNLDD
ncbi:NAD(P)-binding domain-containing protein, partial [Streptomyces alkaliphilus]